jgi:hypothetical protein
VHSRFFIGHGIVARTVPYRTYVTSTYTVTMQYNVKEKYNRDRGKRRTTTKIDAISIRI